MIITIITAFVKNYAEIEMVRYALNGIRVCVCVLILNSILKLSKSSLIDKWTYMIFGVVFALSIFLDVSSSLLVLLAGVTGFLIKKFSGKEKEE